MGKNKIFEMNHLRPAAADENGEGLPYAPENWPEPGDIWGWKSGKRLQTNGLCFQDRYLYLPLRLSPTENGGSNSKRKQQRLSFASKLSVERYIKSTFPGADVNKFFASFTWRIPAAQPSTNGGNVVPIAAVPLQQIPQAGGAYDSDEGRASILQCRAGNQMCNSLNFGVAIKYSPAMSCDICCFESGFCRDCSCILCCKTVSTAHGGYSYIKCPVNAGAGICGHVAHLECALRSSLAGTVGKSIGLDAEYHCRRCDGRTDLVSHVERFVQICKSIKVDLDDEIKKKVLDLGACLLRGSTKPAAKKLLNSVELAISKLKCDNSVITKNATKTMKSLIVTIWSPFQLVQIWALERFLSLQPRPYIIGHGLPKVARWGGVKVMKNKKLKKDLDCAGFGNGFLWQPYENSPSVEVYNERDMWKCNNPCLDKELLSFKRCLRACELVGMGCKEKYFPHRVAMQFGMDQDIPGKVAFCKKDPWMSYSQPAALVDMDLLVQLCSSKPGVTSRYYDWWKQSKSSEEGDNKRVKVEKHQMEGSDEEDDLLVYVISSSDDEVVEIGKNLSSNEEFGDFTSSKVGDEGEINSQSCDRNSEKEESVNPFTLDMEHDLEKRIEKLERMMSKVKKARFGNKP